MVDLCSDFGLEFSVTYNAKKTKCMKFELKPVMPETYPIRFEGKVLEWTTSIKHVGNYIRNDLLESDEITHKQGDFIGRINGLLCIYLTLLAKNDKRNIISKYLQFICETANTKESEVINEYKSHVYKREDILRYEQSIAMIIELNHGIPGFDNDEIKDILYYISTI